MTDPKRRKELLAEAAAHPPDAGVYRITNTATGRSLLASAINLASTRNRFEFTQSTNAVNGLDPRLVADAKAHGIEHLTYEVLDVLEVSPDASADEVRDDLRTLEGLWRDRLDPSTLY